jgi:hypothetical protein
MIPNGAIKPTSNQLGTEADEGGALGCGLGAGPGPAPCDLVLLTDSGFVGEPTLLWRRLRCPARTRFHPDAQRVLWNGPPLYQPGYPDRATGGRGTCQCGSRFSALTWARTATASWVSTTREKGRGSPADAPGQCDQVRLQPQSPCVVSMEACRGAHHPGRILRDQGHHVRLMSPEYVRPHVRTQKMTTGTPRRSPGQQRGRRCGSTTAPSRLIARYRYFQRPCTRM